MDKEAIKGILPHRDPMLLVENAEIMEDGSAQGDYTVKGDEWFLQGHFPGNPVVPGVVLCEMMAQVCCVLLVNQTTEKKVTPYFTSLDKVKFKKPVKPGDTLVSTCRILRNKGPFYFAEGKGMVEGKLAVKGEFSFALIEEK